MRKLTLHEKITIKGYISKKGALTVAAKITDAGEMCRFWNRIYGQPIQMAVMSKADYRAFETEIEHKPRPYSRIFAQRI